MRIKNVKLISGVALSFMLLSGCSGEAAQPNQPTDTGEKKSDAPQVSKDPVTLRFAVSKGWLGQGELEKYMIDPVKKKYPHITLEIIDTSGTAAEFEKTMLANQTPDIVMTANSYIHRYTAFDILDNMEPLIKKINFDVGKLNKVAVDSVKTASGYSYLTGIPWTMHFHPLYYNKDIFDRFGVAYPKDGITWDEAVEVAKKLTREEGGVKYRGLEPDFPYRVASALELGMIDTKTDKASVNNDGWKKVFELLKSIYSIPGNETFTIGMSGQKQFLQERTLAMLTGLNRLPQMAATEGLNWDMVTYPQFKEKPNTSMGVDEWILHVTKQTKYKDQAFQVIETVLSEEVQTEMARNARFPVLTGKNVEEQFGKAIPALAGKNLKAAFLSQPAPAVPVSKYDEAGQKQMSGPALNLMLKNQKDINTVLRESEEIINKYIEQNKVK